MAVQPALTGGELTALAGPGTIRRFLSVVPDTQIATARTNQSSFTYPLAQITVDTTSGWASVREGMTAYIGTSAGAKDKGIYRVRKVPGGSTLYLQAMGSQDPGAVPMLIRNASFADNDYITIWQRFDVWSAIPYINATTGLISEDYDLAVGTFNTTPPAMVDVTINNQQNHLFTYVASGNLSVTATVSVVKWPPSSGSTLSYLWTVPGSWTGVSGTTTATLTATAPPGNYVLQVTVTDSIGGDTKREIVVNVHDPTINPPILIAEQPRSDVRDRSGRRMSLWLTDNRLASIPDGTMVAYFEVATWNGSDVATASRQFVGWVQRQQRETNPGLRDATIDIIGPAEVMNRQRIVSQRVDAVTSPSSWQQVVPSLSTAAFMCWYLMKWRAPNLLRLFNLTVFDTAAAGQRLSAWEIGEGTLLQQIQSLMPERCNFGANSAGSFFFLKHPSYITYGSRTASVVQRDTLTSSLFASASVGRGMQLQVQQVRGEGFSWDGTVGNQNTPYLADAPRVLGQGSGVPKLAGRVVTDQNELNGITGYHYSRQNNPYPDVSVNILKNRDVYEPAELPFVTLTIPAALSADGVQWSNRCIPISVNKQHNADGTADIQMTLEAETSGLAGDTVPVPPPNTSMFAPDFMPLALDPLPLLSTGALVMPAAIPAPTPAPGPSVRPLRAAIRATDTKVYRTVDRTASPPVWDDITPAGVTSVRQVIHSRASAYSREVYLIADNAIYYSRDGYATSPVWQTGGTLTGKPQIIESDKAGRIHWMEAVYGTGTWNYTFDFTAGEQGWTIINADYGASQFHEAQYSAGNGFQAWGYNDTASGDHLIAEILSPLLALPASVTQVDVEYSTTYVIGGGGGDLNRIRYNYDGSITFSRTVQPLSTGTNTASDVASSTMTRIRVQLQQREDSSAIFGADGYVSAYIRKVKIYGTGNNPFDISSYSSYSSDDGLTFDTPDLIEASAPANMGYAAGYTWKRSLAGKTATAREQTALGSTWADETNGGTSGSYPIALCIPDYKIGSTKLINSAASCDYLMASAALVSGEALWKIVSGTKTAITPSVSAVKAVGVSPYGLAMWRGKKIMFIGDVSGVRYLFRSSDAGVTWSYTAMTDAYSVRPARWSATGNEWIVALNTGDLKYSSNGGVSWSTITASGANRFAELLG